MTKLLTSVAVAAVFLGVHPASAQDGNPAYNATLYYDAAHQNLMGTLTWTSCDRFNNPLYTLNGTYNAQHYAVNELVGYCVDGQMEPV